MRRSVLCGLVAIGLLTYAGAAPAQRPREEIAMELVTRWDGNQDGLLTADEVPARARPALVRLSREAGLDPAEPLPLDRLRKHLEQQGRSAKGKPNKPLKRSGGSPPADQELPRENQPKPASEAAAEPSQPESPETRSAPAQSAASAPGFDGSTGKRATQGFGSKTSPAAVPSVGDDAKGQTAQAKQDEPATTKRGKAGEKDRVRGAAQAMLRRFDRDRSGVLEEEEWRRIRGNPQRSDANGDGILTVDELAVHLADYARGTRPSSATSGSKSTAASKRKPKEAKPQGSRKTSSRRSYRFLTATERVAKSLPGNLRDWFLQNDRDGDGQVAMYEFASTWSMERTREFTRLDLNNDGFLTPREYVKAKTTP